MANQTTISVTKPGSYSAVVTAVTGCKAFSAPKVLIFNPIPTALISSGASRSICFGESTTLVANDLAGASYLWSTGETTKSIVVKTAGKYSVKITSSTGCMTQSDEVKVSVNPLPVIQPTPAAKICTIMGQELVLKGEDGFRFYTWDGIKNNISTFKVKKPGRYTLIVEDHHGCTASTVFEVVPWCEEIIIPNTFTPNGDGINDLWKVEGLERDPAAIITIFDRNGTKIFTTNGRNPVWDGLTNGKEAPAGVYFYVVRSSGGKKALSGSLNIIK